MKGTEPLNAALSVPLLQSLPCRRRGHVGRRQATPMKNEGEERGDKRTGSQGLKAKKEKKEGEKARRVER